MSNQRFQTRTITRVSGENSQVCPDHLALEEPLEVQIAFGPEATRESKTIAITMRTPGHDRELAGLHFAGHDSLQGEDRARGDHDWIDRRMA